MGMFGKKDGKFIVLMVCSAAVCLVTVAAPTEPVLAWWIRWAETCGDVTQDCK